MYCNILGIAIHFRTSLLISLEKVGARCRSTRDIFVQYYGIQLRDTILSRRLVVVVVGAA